MNKDELKIILDNHKLWLKEPDNPSGKRANFRNANLSGTDFLDANIRGVNFRGANLRCTDFQNTDLWWANFEDADLSSADFRGANLTWANFRGANLQDIKIDNNTKGLPESFSVQKENNDE